jgi:hypothetical protein
MGSIKNILEQCQRHEEEYAKHGDTSRDRDINRGWIECSKFFFSNFDVTEKTIERE